jgi:hypothetical protein
MCAEENFTLSYTASRPTSQSSLETLDAVTNLNPIFGTCSWQRKNLVSLSDNRHRQQVVGVSRLTNVRPDHPPLCSVSVATEQVHSDRGILNKGKNTVEQKVFM